MTANKIDTEMGQLELANKLIEQWPDELRWRTVDSNGESVTALAKLFYEVSIMSLGLSPSAVAVIQTLNRHHEAPEVKALRVIAETLFCLGVQAGQSGRVN